MSEVELLRLREAGGGISTGSVMLGRCALAQELCALSRESSLKVGLRGRRSPL